MKTATGKLGSATFSDCERYRYLLTRDCGNALPSWWVTWVMLNPSTADHDKNDHTITKCIEFSLRAALVKSTLEDDLGERFGVRIVNLYAIRATDPKKCRDAGAPIGGRQTDELILSACRDAALVVCAWGAQSWARDRANEVRRMLVAAEVPLHCIGQTKDGHPKHPLMVPYAQPIERWMP